MSSEAEYVADRSALRALWRAQPDLTIGEYARRLQRSESWARKWLRRFAAVPHDDRVLFGLSRARKHPPPSVPPAVVEAILAIRDQPPEQLRRVPGPKTIAYYLPRLLPEATPGLIPKSPRTIWQILHQYDRILSPQRFSPTLRDRPAPLTWWQLDFKDSRFVPPDPDGKQLHMVETLDILDVGSDWLLCCEAAADYTAETVFPPLVATLRRYGLPDGVTFDRDPRWVGSHTGRDFPSAFVRFWYCLGVLPDICPPRRPDLNGVVERFHRTLDEECLQVDRPDSLATTREAAERFAYHYNYERPNQSIVCGNRPPATAYPELPTRPALPEEIDPDGWLQAITGKHYARVVKRDGCVEIGDRLYYVKTDLAGQQVTLQVEATTRSFLVWHRQQVVKRLAMKGLVGHGVSWNEYLRLIIDDARSQWRDYLRRQRQKRLAQQAS
jgi:transposase InsO family protein